MRQIPIMFLCLLLCAATASAAPGSAVPTGPVESGWLAAPGETSPEFRATTATGRDAQNVVLLIETTPSAVGTALSELGIAYDLYQGDEMDVLDLTGYEHVFVAMDGGSVTAPDILNLADFASGGGNLHFFGGTALAEFPVAVSDYLVGVDTADYGWTTVASSPHSSIVNAQHYLAYGLGDTDFVDITATYYQTRTTESGLSVAAVNGDGYNQLFAKPYGEGIFDWCINLSDTAFFSDPADYAWLRQVVENMYLGVRNSVLVIETTTTAVPTALTELGIDYDQFSGADFSALDLTFYEHVFVAMDGGLIEDASIANVQTWVQGGDDRHLHFLGGTCHEPFAQSVSNRLVLNNTADYCWSTVAGSPHSTVTNGLNYLAAGLPSTYDFADLSATYYQTRITDSNVNVAAVNGDGYSMLFGKIMGNNAGTFDWLISLVDAGVLSDPADYAWARRVIRNMMLLPPPAPVGMALFPSRDVTLYEEWPDNANGAGQHFFVGNNGVGQINRGLLHFDVAGALPPGAVVTQATLRLFNSRTNLLSGVQDVQLQAVTSDWGEAGSDANGTEGSGDTAQPGDATWNNRFHPDVAWTLPGGDFDAAVVASAQVDWLGYYTWSDPMMTAAVQSWLDSPAGNHGLILRAGEIGSSTAKRFDSKENGNPDLRPVLFVEYLPEPPGVPLAAAKDATLYEENGGDVANGSGEHLFTGHNGVDLGYHSVLSFDLANSIPSGAVVNGVTLRLHMSRTNPDAGPRLTSLHRVGTDWSEGPSNPGGEEGAGDGVDPGDATWLHTNYPDAFWNAAGGDFAPAPSAALVVDDLGYYEWSSAQMAADVEFWASQPGSNFGWLIRGDESEATTAKRFDSRENPEPLFRPVLYVDWSMPDLPTDLAIQPDMDVTLYGELPGNQANGAGEFFFTGNNAVGASNRAALRFDVAGSLPPGAIVTDAMLVAFMSKTNEAAGPRWTSLQRLTSDWGEGASDAGDPGGGGTTPETGDATWLHTFYPDEFWDSPGGDFEPGARATQRVDGVGYYAWSGRNLLLDVQAWAADPASNHGWLMIGDESEPTTAKRFNTRENLDSGTWPALLLNYVVPGEFTLYPVQDATLYGELPGDQANGAGAYFFTGNNGVNAPNRGLLQFDLSGIPTDAVIEDVELTCTMSKTNTSAPAALTSLHRVLNDWGEGASDAGDPGGGGTTPLPNDATWLHTFYPDAYWDSPGGDFDATNSATTLVDTEGVYSWQDPQLIAEVQAMVSGEVPNFGWLMMGDEGMATTAKRFNTREHPDAGTWPVLRVVWGATDASDDQPASAHLRLAAHPNPFNPKTTVSFVLASAQELRVDVFDINGRRVAKLWDGPAEAGRHQIDWEGRDDAGVPQSSGVYFFQLRSAERTETLKGVLLK